MECLKKGSMAVLELQVRLLILSFHMGGCIVTLYKGKDDKCECSNSIGISLLSVVGKRMLMKRVRVGTECAIGEGQCGFR